MAPTSPKPRANRSTSNSVAGQPRSKSRQSTMSIHSNATPPALPYQQTSESAFQAHAQSIPSTYRPTPEEMLASSQHQLINPNDHFAIDPSLSNHSQHPSHTMPYQMESYNNPSSNAEQILNQNQPLARKPSLSLEIGNDEVGQDDTTADGKRKKGSASSQANDLELRRLFRENEGRDLREVALQVVKDDKGPKSEKTKQIFGMIWLFAHCRRSSGSVPRNRVFAAYAERCGTERVPLLNPASFGKLVRIIFPGIMTRRLGVRGESKYHYVDLSLITESLQEQETSRRSQSVAFDCNELRHVEMATKASLRHQLPTDTALFPASSNPTANPIHAPTTRANMASSTLYLQTGRDEMIPRTNMICRPLYFPTTNRVEQQGDDQLILPSIEPYLPPGTDADAVSSLISVYRSHCLLAIDNFRYCKTEKLCDSYKSLIGLLTIPGQKLLAHPKIAAWIRECDWLKYQKMMPMLDMVVLAQVPRKAMGHMEYVALHICPWIAQFFQNQPQHVLDAMLGPANVFVSLLERFFRVNRSASDVAEVLGNAENRDSLWNDWISRLKPYHVVQNSLQEHGHTRLLHILTVDARRIINPSDARAFVGGDGIFEKLSEQSGGDFDNISLNEADGTSAIETLANFVHQLPSRFPHVNARTLLTNIEVIGNNVSRNLTLHGASSLGDWWRIKLFIDEVAYWIAERGGFLEHGSDSMSPKNELSHDIYSAEQFGFDRGSEDFGPSRPMTAASTRMDQRLVNGYVPTEASQNVSSHSSSFRRSDNHRGSVVQQTKDEERQQSRHASTIVEDEGLAQVNDDSGIGLGLEDHFGIDGKYESFVEGVHGSDPADVVVC